MSDEPITAIDKLREIERELAIRQKWYPLWLKEDPPRITLRVAAYRIDILKKIATDYRRELGLIQPQLPLEPDDADHEPEAKPGSAA